MQPRQDQQPGGFAQAIQSTEPTEQSGETEMEDVVAIDTTTQPRQDQQPGGQGDTPTQPKKDQPRLPPGDITPRHTSSTTRIPEPRSANPGFSPINKPPDCARSSSPTWISSGEEDSDSENNDGEDNVLANLCDGPMDGDEPIDDEEGEPGNKAGLAVTRFISDGAGQTAYAQARKNSVEVWEGAAQTFGLSIDDVRTSRVNLSEAVGLSASFRPLPHQLVAAVEGMRNLAGPRGALVLADDMGMSKTISDLLIWYLNFATCYQAMGISKTPDFPYRNEHNLETPNLYGATYFVASSQGFDTVVASWVMMMAGSTHLADDRGAGYMKPKLILLHGSSEEIAQRYGGEKNGIYCSMTQKEWEEVNRRPDWATAQMAYSEEHKFTRVDEPKTVEFVDAEWADKDPYNPTPGRTGHGPAKTSAHCAKPTPLFTTLHNATTT